MIPTVTVPEVAEGTHLLDVREPEEWAGGHAPDAQHVPMGELPTRLAEVPTDQDVVVVCRSGVRSAHVVHFLIDHGWRNVANLEGGMQQWAAAGRPMVSDGGGPASVL
ncbi:rhodanese-like domain-containing protein [Natronosporangium hydrolyticum]|uniref:Rhodanese-like domain-containing protein n=1 Tax=Natronosporangium hydrolyticum TaxID=2811111 RepID=A0A895YBY9_9ACTN|nr:rhodanese-like domain-containing protein [Natronosporangium hydrolyticum]QSB14961.1 rhodanese-like domain-containing protein [Natronosporangium hydrolyticum]